MADRAIDAGTDVVSIEVSSGVGILRFNRPERRNALHDDMYEPMIRAVEDFAADPDVGCVVVTGVGSAFCAGGDVRAGSGRPGQDPRARAAELAEKSRISVVLHEAPIVTIAAVNGPAVGAGMSIALACDFRIAASSARLVGGWAPLAFSGDLGGPWLLARKVGHAKALELLAMNTTVDAEMGRDLGLFDRVVADDEFDRAWREWAGAFAAGPRTAIGYMKTNIRQAWTMSLSDAVAAEAEHQVAASASPDHREGVRAWIEKRPPRFGQRGEDRRLGDGAVGAAPT